MSRALNKLQLLLKQRGITISATALGVALGADSLTAAPAGLAVSVSVAALAGMAIGTGMLTNLVYLMARTKTKAALVALLGLATTAGVGFFISTRPTPPHSDRAIPLSPEALSTNAEQWVGTLAATASSKSRGPSPEIRDAIANLWNALHEEPSDEDGATSPHKVANALRAFGSEVGLAIPTLVQGLQESSDDVQGCSIWGLGRLT